MENLSRILLSTAALRKQGGPSPLMQADVPDALHQEGI